MSVISETVSLVAQADRLMLAGVFLVAGSLKAYDIAAFDYTFTRLGLSQQRARYAAAIVILSEAAVGFCLLLNVWAMPAAIVATILLSAFAIGGIYANKRRLDVPCGCFGGADERLGPASSFRALLLLTAAVAYAVVGSHVGPLEFRPTNVVASLIVGGCLLITGRWLLFSPELVDLVRTRRMTGKVRTMKRAAGSV